MTPALRLCDQCVSPREHVCESCEYRDKKWGEGRKATTQGQLLSWSRAREATQKYRWGGRKVLAGREADPSEGHAPEDKLGEEDSCSGREARRL